MEKQNKEMFNSTNIVVEEISFELIKDNLIQVKNQSNNLIQIHFKHPVTEYSFYANYNFGPGVWCVVNPNQVNFSFIYIELIYEDRINIIKYFIEEKKFEDISTPLVTANNFDLIPNTTTFLIAAFKAQNFILDTIKSILNLETRYQKIEILIGVDACHYTTKKLIESKLPENVKIYFFQENIGPYPIFNTLAEKAKGKNIIFFGADDLAMPNLLEVFNKNIIKYDLVRFGCYSFKDGDDYNNQDNLKLLSLVVGGCKGIKKSIFLELNGYFKWRASADDEFGRRIVAKNIPYIDLVDEPTFLYRQHLNNISHNKLMGQGSMLRNVYRGILTDKISGHNFPNPEKLYTENSIRIY
jgi:hypothetical protein